MAGFSDRADRFSRIARSWSFFVTLASWILGLAAAAAGDGRAIDWGSLVLILGASLSFHAGANLYNTYGDWEREVDNRIYPNGNPIVLGETTSAEVLDMGHRCTAVGIGLIGVLGGYKGILWGSLAGYNWQATACGVILFLLGLGLEIFYSLPPGLKYCGLGDVSILIAWGVCIPSLTYMSQRGTVGLASALPFFLPSSLLAVAILHANNMRDARTDALAGAKTPAVVMGPRLSQAYFAILMFLPFVASCIVAARRGSLWPLLPLFAAPLALKQVRQVACSPATSRTVRAVMWCHVAHATLTAAGCSLAAPRGIPIYSTLS